MTRWFRPLLGGAIGAGVLFAPRASPADDSAPTPPASLGPPPAGHAYIQYGVAFTVEGVASAGPICEVQTAPCILGSGGGIVARVGWRPAEELYIGGGYEFSKQDPNNLYRLGILQQARAELRRYFPTGSTTAPFFEVGAGLAGYGDEWQVDTWGLAGTVGAGLELELSGALHLGVALVYRPLYLMAWRDSSLTEHHAGVAHLIGLELALEAQDRLGAAWRVPQP